MASKLFLLLAACLAGGWYGTLEERRVVEAPVSLDSECLSPGGAGSAHSRHRRVWALVARSKPIKTHSCPDSDQLPPPPLSSSLNSFAFWCPHSIARLSFPSSVFSSPDAFAISLALRRALGHPLPARSLSPLSSSWCVAYF